MPEDQGSLIETLSRLAQDKSVAGRTKLVSHITELMFGSERKLSKLERTLVGEILREIVKNAETVVRATLAEHLAERSDAPKDLVAHLAKDDFEVARPILMRSALLDDGTLLKIVRHSTAHHRLAIAARATVNEPVADALMSAGESEVIQKLLENEGAKVPQGAMDFLREQAELLRLARDKSKIGRTKLVACVSDNLFAANRKLSQTERTLIGDILGSILGEVETAMRGALSERLADKVDAPEEIVRILANDEIEVARPILMRSRLLADPELLEIVQLRSVQHRFAVAARETISEEISDALVSAGEPQVIERLLENEGAQLSQSAVESLVKDSKHIEAYQEPLLNRQELSPQLASRMYRWVSAALRKHILSHFDVDPKALDTSLKETIDTLLAQSRSRGQSGEASIDYAKLVKNPKTSNPLFLIALLKDGKVQEFEGLFAEHTGLPLETAQHFIYGHDGEPFAIACKGIAMSKASFMTIFTLTRRARSGSRPIDPQRFERATGVFDRVPQDVAKGILDRWQKDPDYLPLLKHFPLEQFSDLEMPDRAA